MNVNLPENRDELRASLRAIDAQFGIMAPFMIFGEGLPPAPIRGAYFRVQYRPPAPAPAPVARDPVGAAIAETLAESGSRSAVPAVRAPW